MKQVVIRADATVRIASGHIMRCLTLANALKKAHPKVTVTFLSGPLPDAIKQHVLQANVILRELPLNVDDKEWQQAIDVDQSIAAISDMPKIDLLVVDHYALDERWENRLAAFCDKLLVIDDIADRPHNAHFLLDQTFARKQGDYSHLIPANCKCLLGTQFSLLRDEFTALRESAIDKRKAYKKTQKLLISLGGLDANNVTGKVLSLVAEALENTALEDLSIVVIISSDAPHLSQLKQQIRAMSNVELIQDCQNMSAQLLAADIAIGASGGSSWERCVMALPTLSVVLADNQETIANELAKQGAIINLGHIDSLSVDTLRTSLEKVTTKDHYHDMMSKCLSVCDGLGAQRVVSMIADTGLSLKRASIEDVPLTFKWQSNPKVRKYSRNPNPVEFEEHQAWFASSLSLATRFIFIIHFDGIACGILRFDEKSQDTYEISILIDPKMQGKGVALLALLNIPNAFRHKNIYAFVNPENKASQKLFTKAMFEQVSVDEFILKPSC